ncbi:hypothetical protein QQX98_008695 [Neonectria punicea]|uniref:Uncharacterized protein n=1 Tax=Neonectria punicea TaxID=979145 RepID=A0ABR1GUJ0_9HYPO
MANQTTASPELPVLIIGAGISGLVLAQRLRREGIPSRVFERDADLTTRGVGWGLTLHWSLPALRELLPDNLVQRLPDAYVERAAVETGASSAFPFFNLTTGEMTATTPKAPESQRIRVTRERLRQLLATEIEIEAVETQSDSLDVYVWDPYLKTMSRIRDIAKAIRTLGRDPQYNHREATIERKDLAVERGGEFGWKEDTAAENENLAVEQVDAIVDEEHVTAKHEYATIVNAHPALSEQVVTDTAQRFTGDSKAVAGRMLESSDGKDGTSFLVTTSVFLKEEDQATLNELCQLQANWIISEPRPCLQPATSTESDPRSSGRLSPGRRSPGRRPSGPLPSPFVNTFRALDVPRDKSKADLQAILEDCGISEESVHILSLAPTSPEKACATFAIREPSLQEWRKLNVQLPDGIRVDEDFLGITPLYDAPENKAVVDIIAIPGLGSKPIWTFRPPGQQQIWLRDFLPRDIPNCRVLLYGYESRVPESDDTSRIKETSDYMYHYIHVFRRCTQMLHDISKMAESGQDQDILRSFVGFMFFGVPNNGLVNSVLHDMSHGYPNQELIREVVIEPNAQIPEKLSRLNDDFADIVTKLESSRKRTVGRACFHEKHISPTAVKQEDGKWKREGPKVLMVNKESASQPLLRCAATPIESDHYKLAKFCPGQIEYKIVADKLEEWIKSRGKAWGKH